MSEDGLQNATVPLSFKKAMDMLSKDQAKDLVRTINKFMKEFQRRPPDAVVDSRTMQEVFIQMEHTVHKHPLFQGAQAADVEEFMEAVERYLLIKLYDRTFGRSTEDAERDELLTNRMAALQFVRPEHLEVSPKLVTDTLDSSLQLAVKALVNMNLYKAPRDKLVCILNCCRVINNLLSSSLTGDIAGADDFTPILIYTVIKAQPQHLASNLAFIERYRMQSRLVSEAHYYFIQLSSAAAFIETLNAHSLKVEHDEFIAHMLQHGAMTEEELFMGSSSPRSSMSSAHQSTAQQPTAAAVAERTTIPPQSGVKASAEAMPAAPFASQPPSIPTPFAEPTPPPAPPPIPPRTLAELETDGVKLLLVEEASGHLHKKYKFLYTAVDDLLVGDVQVLLSDYKELALKYEMLRLAVENQALEAARQLQNLGFQSTTAPAAALAAGPGKHPAPQLLDLWSTADDSAPVLMSGAPAQAAAGPTTSCTTPPDPLPPPHAKSTATALTAPGTPTAICTAPAETTSSKGRTEDAVVNLLGDPVVGTEHADAGTDRADIILSPMPASAAAVPELMDLQQQPLQGRSTGAVEANTVDISAATSTATSAVVSCSSRSGSPTRPAVDLNQDMNLTPVIGLRRPEPVAATEESPGGVPRVTPGLPQTVMDLLA